MIAVLTEADPIKYGFNFYPWSERATSIGVKIKFGPRHMWSFRWNRTSKKIYCGFTIVTKAQQKLYEDLFHNESQ